MPRWQWQKKMMSLTKPLTMHKKKVHKTPRGVRQSRGKGRAEEKQGKAKAADDDEAALSRAATSVTESCG